MIFCFLVSLCYLFYCKQRACARQSPLPCFWGRGRGWGLLLTLGIIASPAFAQQRAGELLRNGGFEGGSGSDGKGGGVPEWEPYELGYRIDRATHREGDQAIRCDSVTTDSLRGAQTTLILNQKRPTPIAIVGWSKADQVSGSANGDYAVYVDLEYADGTPLYGQLAPFRAGTHDWERRQVLLLPQKPVRKVTVFALFRRHAGTAWFDDFSAHELSGAGLFDGQPMPPFPNRAPAGGSPISVRSGNGLRLDFAPDGALQSVYAGEQKVSGALSGGFFVRDVAADGPLIPMRGTITPSKSGGYNISCASPALHVRFNGKVQRDGDTIALDGDMTDTTRTDRAMTVYFALPVKADGWQWGDDIRHAQTIEAGREYSTLTHVNVGATGGLSLYPFGCVSSGPTGVGIASQMDWPSVFRLFYNGGTRQFVIAWDVALTSKTAAWPARNARFRCKLFRLAPNEAAWGFRGAAARFYRLNASAYVRRARADGIWMPFTDPSKVKNVADFGVAYHEGDNSIQSDDALGILSFRYTEPMTYWLPMPPDLPRTYENALALINAQAKGENLTQRHRDAERKDSRKDAKTQSGEAKGNGEQGTVPNPDTRTPIPDTLTWARAVLNSGSQDEGGRFNLEFQDAPWANGAVFTLNPNPELPATPDQPTKSSLSYTLAQALAMYGEKAQPTRGEQDGEYLDSLEGWADVQDYRPSHLSSCPYPLPYDVNSRRPTLPQWYSTHTFTRFLCDDLHNRGKLLMANTTPVRFSIYAPLLDVMGIEVNWLDGANRFTPDSDEIFNLRRALSGQKPYLLLMNTDFDRFDAAMVERYFQRCLFYGVFPSMFSANAATHPYWEEPRWIERDRPLFKKYIPQIKRLSAAGWEPITHARSQNPAVYVERYGSHLLTVMNSASQPEDTVLTVEAASGNGKAQTISLHLKPEEVQILDLQTIGR